LAPAITIAITYAISSTMLTQNRSWLRSCSAAIIMTGSTTVARPSAQLNAQWLAGRGCSGAVSAGGGQSARGRTGAGRAGMFAVAAASSA